MNGWMDGWPDGRIGWFGAVFYFRWREPEQIRLGRWSSSQFGWWQHYFGGSSLAPLDEAASLVELLHSPV